METVREPLAERMHRQADAVLTDLVGIATVLAWDHLDEGQAIQAIQANLLEAIGNASEVASHLADLADRTEVAA